MIRLRALRHTLRGTGAVGALQVEQLRQGRTGRASGGSAQRDDRLEALAIFAQGSSTLLPERQERRRASGVAAVRVAAGAVLLWLVAAHLRDFGRAALQVRADPAARLRTAVPSTSTTRYWNKASDVGLKYVHRFGMSVNRRSM